MSTVLEIVPLKNNLFTDYRYNEVKKLIVERIHELGMMNEKYKLDNEFLTFITNIIENIVQKKDKIDKKQLVISILKEQFNATPEDIDIIARNIDYLHQNKFIKKLSYYKLFKAGVREWFSKK